MKITNIVEGYKVLPPISPIDKEKYQPRSGLEGPFRLRNGKVVYYDPQEGSYYDPDTDLYISYDDYKKMDEEEIDEISDKTKLGYVAKATKNIPQLQGKKGHIARGTSDWRTTGDEYAAADAKTSALNKKIANRKQGINRALAEEEADLDKDVSTQIADLIRKKNSVSSPIARKNIDSQIALLKRKRDKTNEEQGVVEGDKRPKYVVTTKDKPKIVKPSMGGESPHPYQGKLVGATESSQWGEPEDVLRQVLQTLEREVEWPLTDVMDPQQVKQLLSPLMQAVSQKLNSLDEAEVSNTDYEFTHGKKPGGQGSWFFVAHRGGINFSKDVEGEDYVELHGMSYGDAKKAAVKWAKSKGHTSLFVAT